jgi:hypothetical protein
MAKDSEELKKLLPGKTVTVYLPALMRSGSISSSVGNLPIPRIPFSDYMVIFTPSSRKLEHRVGIPIPRFTYIPSLSSLAALVTILLLLT